MSSELPITVANIRYAAMNMLAMREHSALELRTKLKQKFELSELIEEAVARLTEQGLQSDMRFAEAFTAMRQRQGKGSSLIKMELRERGVAEGLVSDLINEFDHSWVELASRARTKRFGCELPADLKDRAKQMRFLQGRGFALHHIQALFSSTSL